LACDFLKELGYRNYGKPDIHIKEIFKETGLNNKGATDYQTLKAVIRIAESNTAKSNEVTPYNVDKLFWLIGSGYFYNHEEIGKEGRVPSMKKGFIEHMKSF